MNVNELINKHGFRFSKKYGQNFIGDENLLAAIVSDAGVTESDAVIEIGAGAGTLTRQIALKAKRVISFEIDRSLEPVLGESLEGIDNAQVIFADVMEYTPEKIDEIAGGKFRLVANLPYYITTPVLFKLFECKNMVSATVMVQKEVAERICAKQATPEYGALSVALQTKSKPVVTRIVKRTCFTPPPNVDSAIVRMDRVYRSDVKSPETLEKLTRAAFAMRRKTLVNNLTSAMNVSRADAEALLTACDIPVMTRGEALSVEQFISLSNLIAEKRSEIQ
ncbi:MAG: 16S rRNA (adenine(1518)-N(6)/adenine(1519)-N(6))-dimethyltransferase RsmA [Candidatus Neoclostridium sp.]